jgi:hypothetical protein
MIDPIMYTNKMVYLLYRQTHKNAEINPREPERE